MRSVSIKPVPQAGESFEHPYPFILEEVELPGDEGGSYKTKSWRPGTRYEMYMGGRFYEPQEDCVADGIGKQIITVVSVHKPGRFPTRIFFTRQWEDPRGRRFGKSNLRCKTLASFRNLIGGFKHPIDRVGEKPVRAA